MVRLCSFVVCLTGVLCCVGCGGFSGGGSASSASSGGIAVVDLDLVAKTLNRTEVIAASLQSKKSDLDRQLQQVQGQLRDELLKKKEELGEEPTDDQKKEFVLMDRKAGAVLTQAGRQAQAILDKTRRDFVAEFRNEIRPVAQQVAAAKGLSVVIPKNEGFLLAIDPGVDITDEVIKALQARKPAAAPAAASAPAKAAPQTAAKPDNEQKN